MRARLSRAPEAALGFEPRRLPLALARTLLACAEAVGIACTPDRTLLPSAAPYPDGMRCAGIRSASAWCVLGPGADGRLAARIVEIVILVLVASGFRPRWTCVPHWYAAFSLAAAAVQPSGEDEITVIAVLLLVPLCLGDTRIWHWSPPGAPLAPAWRGAALSAWWLLRIQLFIVYIVSSSSKLASAGWRAGTAMDTVFTDPVYGLPQVLRPVAVKLATLGWPLCCLTYAVVATEFGIAFCMLAGARWRRAGLILACALHGGIILAMGLVEFGATMIAVVLIAWLGSDPHPRTRLPVARARPGSSLSVFGFEAAAPGPVSEVR